MIPHLRLSPRTTATSSTARRTPGLRRGAVLAAGIAMAALLAPVAAAAPVQQVATADDPAVTFGLQPTQKDGKDRPNFVVDLKPGEELKDSFRVRNNSSRKQTFTLFAGDAFNAETGAIDLPPTGQESRDIGSWITLEKNDIELASGQFTDIGFTMKVPTSATPGDHQAAIVASLKTTSSGGGPAVTVDNRIGTRVILRVAGALNPKMTISDLKTSFSGPINPLGPGTMDVSYRVTNDGNVTMGASQSIKFNSPIGFPSKTFTPKDPVPELLPGNSITQSFKVDGVWPALRTSTKVTVTPIPAREGDSFEAGVTVHAKASNWTIPWAFLAFVVIIAAIVGFLKVRRDKQRAADESRLQTMLDDRLAGSGAGPISPNGNA